MIFVLSYIGVTPLASHLDYSFDYLSKTMINPLKLKCRNSVYRDAKDDIRDLNQVLIPTLKALETKVAETHLKLNINCKSFFKKDTFVSEKK